MNDFDGIAWCYDKLKSLAFGDQLDRATHHHFAEIDEGSRVLIIGGGTGELLRHLPTNLDINYIEKSSKMIGRAKQIRSNVDFICMDFIAFESIKQYDFVICPFILDLFENRQLKDFVDKIKAMLKQNGKLLVTDFKADNWLHQALIWMMYQFMKYTAGVQASKLPEIEQILIGADFYLAKGEVFSGGLIFSHVYQIRGN